MAIIIQKGDLAGSSFSNNNSNASGGIKVRTDAPSDVGQAIAAAVAAIPAEKFVTSGAYNATTDTLTLTFTDSTTVVIPFGSVILDAIGSIPAATDTVAGKVSLAVAANASPTPSASDTEATTPAYINAVLGLRNCSTILAELNAALPADHCVATVPALSTATSATEAVMVASSYVSPTVNGSPGVWQPVVVDGIGGGVGSGAMTPAGIFRQKMAIGLHIGPDVHSWLQHHAASPTEMAVGTITYDVDGAPTTFNVQWPDGGTGVYTTLSKNLVDPALVDSYRVTYAGPTTFNGQSMATPWTGVDMQVNQPAVTRDAQGRITNRPMRTVTPI